MFVHAHGHQRNVRFTYSYPLVTITSDGVEVGAPIHRVVALASITSLIMQAPAGNIYKYIIIIVYDTLLCTC